MQSFATGKENIHIYEVKKVERLGVRLLNKYAGHGPAYQQCFALLFHTVVTVISQLLSLQYFCAAILIPQHYCMHHLYKQPGFHYTRYAINSVVDLLRVFYSTK